MSLAKAWHTSDVMGLGTSGGPPNAAASDIEGWGSEQVAACVTGDQRALIRSPVMCQWARVRP